MIFKVDFYEYFSPTKNTILKSLHYIKIHFKSIWSNPIQFVPTFQGSAVYRGSIKKLHPIFPSQNNIVQNQKPSTKDCNFFTPSAPLQFGLGSSSKNIYPLSPNFSKWKAFKTKKPPKRRLSKNYLLKKKKPGSYLLSHFAAVSSA